MKTLLTVGAVAFYGDGSLAYFVAVSFVETF